MKDRKIGRFRCGVYTVPDETHEILFCDCRLRRFLGCTDCPVE